MDRTIPRDSLLWLVAIAVFMQMLDTTIVNTALPAMAAGLGESPLRMQAVVIAYALTVAILIPASGWLADRLGTRRVFIAAIALFTLGSLACALSRNLTQIVLARIVQGLGGAMLLPVGRLAVLRMFPGAGFLRAMSLVTMPGLAGPLVGPALGGWLVDFASWHWIFLINLPIGLAGLVWALRVMPDLRGDGARRFDLGGYALLAIGMVAILLALDGLPLRRGGLAALGGLFAAGTAALALYVLRSRRVAEPLFAPALFGVRLFRVGVAGNLVSRLGSSGMPLLIPLLLQVALGYPAAQAGLMMIPVAAASIFIKRPAVRLIGRYGYRRVLIVNTLCVGLSIASFGLIGPQPPPWLLVVQFSVFGAFNSLQFTAMNTVALRDLQGGLASSGNSVLSMVMMLSMSFGVAIAGGLLAAFTGPRALLGPLPVLTGFQITFVCLGVLSLLSALIFWRLEEPADAAAAAASAEEGAVPTR
ncbi:MAG TPA: multidrug transporter subunit MdtD [Dokdonella sp.]|uniref:multidrug transporter subunit MdtD n=1 Tax=Dokdonella sp. TaxID=2291710 RepID=UPI002C77019E|nr:multidrug transporter subunit MdtD [Dokdonella sp.]HUD43317.1 multidrug transporter subunit MdtD [Dokdonella sp.]